MKRIGYSCVLIMIVTMILSSSVMAQGQPSPQAPPSTFQQLVYLAGSALIQLIFIFGPAIAVAAFVVKKVVKQAVTQGVIAGRMVDLEKLKAAEARVDEETRVERTVRAMRA